MSERKGMIRIMVKSATIGAIWLMLGLSYDTCLYLQQACKTAGISNCIFSFLSDSKSYRRNWTLSYHKYDL